VTVNSDQFRGVSRLGVWGGGS